MSADPIPSLSIFLIAHNEADRIERTLLAVRDLTDDLIVVDSGSTDGTQAKAVALGARVIHQPWLGYGLQKRFAEDQCRHDWMLNIDADEIVSSRLHDEIKALFAKGAPEAEAYTIRIAEVFPGEIEPHPLAYALAPVRLYRKSAGRYNPSPVHDRVDLRPEAKIGHLKGRIHHYSVRSLGQQMAKLNTYTDALVDDLEARSETLSMTRLFLEFPASFLKAYIVRRHALRGLYGFMTAMNFAFYRYMRVAKFFERRIVRKANTDKGVL